MGGPAVHCFLILFLHYYSYRCKRLNEEIIGGKERTEHAQDRSLVNATRLYIGCCAALRVMCCAPVGLRQLSWAATVSCHWILHGGS
jgi:hypothetical protein